MHVSFWIRVFIFPEYIPGSTIAGSYGSSSQSYGFSSSHVWMWELNHKEGWEPNNWCFWTVVLVKTLESPLDCKETKPVHPKGNESWIFIGGTDAEAEAPILWPPDVKSRLIWKDPDAGKDWRRKEKGTTEDEMVGWRHHVNGHEFGQALGVGDGQGSWARCSPWGRKESDMTERVNWTELDCSLPGSCPWNFPGKNTGLDCQGIFPTQASNLGLLHLLYWKVDSLPLVPPWKARSHNAFWHIFSVCPLLTSG